MGELLAVLVVLLIGVLLIWGGFWIIDQTGIPNPGNWILKLIVAILVVGFALTKLGISIPV